MFLANKLNKGGSLGGYQISRSLRFNSADSPYLSRTPSSTSSQTTATFSAWVKRSRLGSAAENRMFAESTGSGAGLFWVLFTTSDQIQILVNGSGTGITTTQVFRDPSAYYHVVVAVDTTQATSSNRIKLYVNGSQVTAFTGTQTYYSLNETLKFNVTTTTNYIGYSNSQAFDGYMTEVNWIDGQQLTPSSFGETNADTGVWQPKAYSGSYGTNGFYLNFSDNSNTTAATLGKDYSGNGNNWTPNGFLVSAGVNNDSLVDVPTSYGTDTGAGGTVRGNYATINPLQLIANVSVTNGNLYLQSNNNQDQVASAPSTIAVRTGKWYAEYTASAVSGTPQYMFGVARAAWSPIILDGGGYYGRFYVTSGGVPSGYAYHSNSNFYTNGASVGTGATYASGDIIGIAMDLDAGSITFYKNGVSQGTPFTSIPLDVDYVFAGGVFTYSYPTPTNIGAYFANFGQRPFAYTAPSGFKALCTQNLPTPTIGATTATQAGKYFNPVLYTGNGTTQTISGVGFQPDLVWCKGRSNAFWHSWIDAVRGRGFASFSNVTNAEFTSPVGKELTAFTSDGFSLGPDDGFSINSSGAPFVAWNWKANGAGSTNTAGSITSTVSANTTSGFSVVTYTGNATSNQTFGHGLGAKVDFAIIKSRSAVSSPAWMVWHRSVCSGNGKALALEETNAIQGPFGTPMWDSSNTSTQSSTTTFTIGANTTINASGATYVAYCFAEVAGYSKFGSYTGNGTAGDGPFVYTGFRPVFVMIKASSTTGDWLILDNSRSPYNVEQARLKPNDSAAEVSGDGYDYIDALSNGFKLRGIAGSNGTNGSGNTYIYACFAQNPFKYSLAR